MKHPFLIFVMAALAAFGAGCRAKPDSQAIARPTTAQATQFTKPNLAAFKVMPLEQVPKSQRASVSQTIANTEITLTYSRPLARGRVLFGNLVPYDVVWNPGADDATAIAFTRNVMINGQPLRSGKYTLWMIPKPDRWTVIFSKVAEAYHAFYPGEAEDALRLEVAPESGASMEALTFYFPVVDGKSGILRFHWGETLVPLSIMAP